jgi:phospholipid transport system substrate-binding protein
MQNDYSLMSRRRFAAGFALGSVALALPLPSLALTVGDARTLINKAVGEINTTIDSGKSEQAMYGDFERIFARYADVPVIARSALGVAAKKASAAQMSAFTKTFQVYISRKYGSRFREFIGGKIEVTDAKPLKSYYEVISVAHLKGQAPFDVRWHVSDKSGRSLFFNIIIEGVNMLASERAEIGALLDKSGGDIDKLIKTLKTAA